jgi:hypothetical protein
MLRAPTGSVQWLLYGRANMLALYVFMCLFLPAPAGGECMRGHPWPAPAGKSVWLLRRGSAIELRGGGWGEGHRGSEAVQINGETMLPEDMERLHVWDEVRTQKGEPGDEDPGHSLSDREGTGAVSPDLSHFNTTEQNAILRLQVAAAQAEIARLKEEVQELKEPAGLFFAEGVQARAAPALLNRAPARCPAPSGVPSAYDPSPVSGRTAS